MPTSGVRPAVTLFLSLAAASCSSSRPHGANTATAPNPGVRPAREGTPSDRPAGRTPHTQDATAELRKRATTFWTAKQAENWDSVFEFEDPAERAEMDRVKFKEWSEQNDPFIILKHELRRAEAEGDLGWVEIRYSSRIRRYPNEPPREATTWQKWRRIDSQWYPIPLKRIGDYPDTPVNRDSAGETRIRQRFDETCQARKDRNWEQLFQLFDPRDRSGAAVDGLKEIEDLVVYLECNVLWIEAIGERGKVRVVYKRKANDPSLQKLAPVDMLEVEEWVKVDNEWYRDLKR